MPAAPADGILGADRHTAAAGLLVEVVVVVVVEGAMQWKPPRVLTQRSVAGQCVEPSRHSLMSGGREQLDLGCRYRWAGRLSGRGDSPSQPPEGNRVKPDGQGCDSSQTKLPFVLRHLPGDNVSNARTKPKSIGKNYLQM